MLHDVSFDYLITTINSKLDTHIPMRKIKHYYKRTPRLPWISKSLLRSINRKNNLFYKFKTKPILSNLK